MSVAQASKRVGFVVAVSQFMPYRESLLVVGDGSRIVTQLVMYVAKTIQGSRFPVAVI
jgi:DNA-directed RNA polymerase subunit E'/Rpb7